MHLLFGDYYKNCYNLSRDEILLYIIRKKAVLMMATFGLHGLIAVFFNLHSNTCTYKEALYPEVNWRDSNSTIYQFTVSEQISTKVCLHYTYPFFSACVLVRIF